ncbi:hypothetical protein RMATCC62417_11423 [Rhizopus microsporus]|nr:hypothetical protein RMATCC62417_11423 [Rhizopus microsporus]
MADNRRSLLIYGAAATLVAVLGTSLVYYVIEDDKRAKRRRTAKQAERATLRLLDQIQSQQQAIESSISSVEPIIELDCDDKAFKQKEYTLAHSNELLLRLMEQLDAVRPLTLVVGQDLEPTEFERQIEEEKAQQAREEQERVAKEEALRRIREEEEQAAQEAISKEADSHDDDKSFEEIQSNGQVEVSYIELNEVQEE